jgi:hypothetical protein
MKHAVDDDVKARNAIIDASVPKPVIKKTTQQYFSQKEQDSSTKRVTFI